MFLDELLFDLKVVAVLSHFEIFVVEHLLVTYEISGRTVFFLTWLQVWIRFSTTNYLCFRIFYILTCSSYTRSSHTVYTQLNHIEHTTNGTANLYQTLCFRSTVIQTICIITFVISSRILLLLFQIVVYVLTLFLVYPWLNLWNHTRVSRRSVGGAGGRSFG